MTSAVPGGPRPTPFRIVRFCAPVLAGAAMVLAALPASAGKAPAQRQPPDTNPVDAAPGPDTLEADPFAGLPGSETGRAASKSVLLRDAAAVAAGSFAGVDTAALLADIEAKAEWGELPDRLVEAQGILLWNRGGADAQRALACLRRLPRPRALATSILAEGKALKGDRYESAALHLAAARAFPAADPRAAEQYGKYLAVKPGDAAVEAELAGRLESQGRYDEAARIWLRHPGRAAARPEAALRVGDLLTAQGHHKASLDLYRLAIGMHPADKALRLRLASSYESAGLRLEAGRVYAAAWEAFPSDTGLRDRALAHFEAAGASAEAPLRELLTKSLDSGDGNPRLRFKLAVASLAAGDRAAAYAHLSAALAADPADPTYLSRLPEAIDTDSLIRVHYPVLRAEYEREGGSPRLMEVMARGYALDGRTVESARAWRRLHALAPERLAGRRDAILALGASGDPDHLALSGRLAGPFLKQHPDDRDVAVLLLRSQTQGGLAAETAATAEWLARAHPGEAPLALAAAKGLLARQRADLARPVLAALASTAPSPEAGFLLGRLLHGQKDCALAVPHLEAATEAHPEASRLLGECLEAVDPQRAALAYQSHQSQTGDKESLLALARTQRAVGDPLREREILETLAAKGWAGEKEKLRLGFVHLGLQDSAKASAAFGELYRARSAVPAESAWVEAGILLGARQAAEGRHDKAIRSLTMALKADSTRASAWMALGGSQAARRLWKPAAASFAAAWSAGLRTAELARIQVEVAGRLDDRKALAGAYANLLTVEPDHAEAHARLAAWHQGERNYLDAAHHWRRWLDLRAATAPGENGPEAARAWEGLGNCLALAGDLSAAGEALQKALDLGSDADEIYVNRARAYRHEGAKDMAASILEYLLNRNPRSYLALLWSAKFAEEDGHPQLAMERFKKASRLPQPRSAWPELASQGVVSASALP